MTRDDIIRWAREARLAEPSHPINPWGASDEGLERFANLVAAAEREACAKVSDELRQFGAEAMFGPYWERACVDCAEAIRARGNK
jgi:hypothetical protein